MPHRHLLTAVPSDSNLGNLYATDNNVYDTTNINNTTISISLEEVLDHSTVDITTDVSTDLTDTFDSTPSTSALDLSIKYPPKEPSTTNPIPPTNENNEKPATKQDDKRNNVTHGGCTNKQTAGLEYVHSGLRRYVSVFTPDFMEFCANMLKACAPPFVLGMILLLIPLPPVKTTVSVDQIGYIIYIIGIGGLCSVVIPLLVEVWFPHQLRWKLYIPVLTLCALLMGVFHLIVMACGAFPIPFSPVFSILAVYCVVFAPIGYFIIPIEFRNFKNFMAFCILAGVSDTYLTIAESFLVVVYSLHNQLDIYICIIGFQILCVFYKLGLRMYTNYLGKMLCLNPDDTAENLVTGLFWIELAFHLFLSMTFPKIGVHDGGWIVVFLYLTTEAILLTGQILLDTVTVRTWIQIAVEKIFFFLSDERRKRFVHMFEMNERARITALQNFYFMAMARILSVIGYIFFSIIIYYGWNKEYYPSFANLDYESYRTSMIYALFSFVTIQIQIFTCRIILRRIYERDLFVCAAMLARRRWRLIMGICCNAVIFPFVGLLAHNNILVLVL